MTQQDSEGIPHYVETARLASVVSWLLLYRVLTDRGFVLTCTGVSTDVKAALVIGATSALWTVVVFLAALPELRGVRADGGRPSTEPWTQRTTAHWATLSSAPWLTLGVFFCWTISMLDGMRAYRSGRSPSLWFGDRLHDAFDWRSALHPALHRALTVSLTAVVASTSVLAIVHSDDPLAGLLGLAGLAVFLLDATPHNPWARAPHRYAADAQRVALPTTHHEGTLYVLPAAGRGIDATWCPKVADEHGAAEGEIMALFRHMRAGRWLPSEPLERLRQTMARFHSRLAAGAPQGKESAAAQAERLARWIYAARNDDGGADPAVRRIECVRAPGVHLIGRDLMFALCHAEYVVLMAQDRLAPELRDKMGLLRLMARSGAGRAEKQERGAETAMEHDETVGYRPGYEGYRQAVEHVYAIFDLPLDEAAVQFTVPPPAFSSALSKTPASIDEYVAELWDLSTLHSESTFSALYFFTTVWFMELGNVNGFHIFPLRVRSRQGDQVSQQIVWRQALWAAVVAQLISVSPLFFGAFVGGFMSSP